MRRTSPAGTAEPNGSIIMWLAGLVFGVSAGLLLVYHALLSSRAAPLPIEAAQAAPTGFGQADALQPAHRDALNEAAR